jgi:hypothetical protein
MRQSVKPFGKGKNLGVIPGRREAASPESIPAAVVMDSGLADFVRAPE